MASRKIISNKGGDYPPTVKITAAPGVSFVGKYLAIRDGIKTQYGPKAVYQFAIQDTTAPIVRRAQNGGFVEVNVNVGDTVEIFSPPSVLDGMLRQVVVGETVKIVYTGLAPKKPGKNPAYLFDVEVIA